MMVRKLDLVNFRCYPALSLELPAGLVVVTGPNASGKSSLLEAIFVASAGRSQRTARDSELVRWGCPAARVEAIFEREAGRTLDVVFELERSGPKKRLLAEGQPVRRAAELLARVPLVLFTPADLQLAQAAPVVRRRFMNLALARLRPAYADDLARYSRALLQRNRLLTMGAKAAELRPWTAQMVAAGAEVALARKRFAGEIVGIAAEVHAALAGEAEKLGVEYTGNMAAEEDASSSAEHYEALLAKSSAEEGRLRRTMVGPHRDDMRLTLGGQALRRFGSQGQQRTAALALKLAEAELIKRETGAPPLLLLDDCLSELDEGRAAQVLGLTETYGQLIVTSAAREAALERASAARWLHLRDGEVERVE